MAGVLAWFWNERFWLPHNVTWADLKSTEEASFPQAEDLLLAAPLAFCLFLLRMLFERWALIVRVCSVCECVCVSQAFTFYILRFRNVLRLHIYAGSGWNRVILQMMNILSFTALQVRSAGP